MAYRVRDGVVLVKIQDIYLIVSSAPCWKECPYITETNEMGAYIWRQLEEHREVLEIVDGILDEYDVDDRQRIESDVRQFIQEMRNSNYLIPERNDDT